MISSLYTTLTKKGLKKLRRDLGRSRRTKTAANAWLTYTYGILPLAYAYNDALKAIRNARRTKFRTMVSERVSTDGLECIIKVSGRVRATSLTGRVILNPLRTGWELLPYSFVIDWFTNIGNVLSAVGTHMNPFVTITGSVSTKLEWRGEARTQSPNETVIVNDSYSIEGKTYTYVKRSEVTTGSPGWVKYSRDEFHRTILTPRLLTLQFNANFDWKKAITSASLIRQRL